MFNALLLLCGTVGNKREGKRKTFQFLFVMNRVFLMFCFHIFILFFFCLGCHILFLLNFWLFYVTYFGFEFFIVLLLFFDVNQDVSTL